MRYRCQRVCARYKCENTSIPNRISTRWSSRPLNGSLVLPPISQKHHIGTLHFRPKNNPHYVFNVISIKHTAILAVMADTSVHNANAYRIPVPNDRLVMRLPHTPASSLFLLQLQHELRRTHTEVTRSANIDSFFNQS